MSRRIRRWIGFTVTTTVVVAVLFWLPKAAQAGISMTGVD